MFSEGMTLFFLDHHNTTLPYPRVLRLDGEAAPNGIQLRPGSAHQQALEQALNHTLQHPAPGAHAQAQETTFQLRPAHDKDQMCIRDRCGCVEYGEALIHQCHHHPTLSASNLSKCNKTPLDIYEYSI